MDDSSTKRDGTLDRRDFLKTAGAALAVGAFGLPGSAAVQPTLRIFLATSSRPCRSLFLHRFRPMLKAQHGMDSYFPLVHRAALYSNPRRILRTMTTLLGQGELDFAVIPESLLPALVAALPEHLVDLSGLRSHMAEQRVDFLPTGEEVFAFNLLDGTVTVGLSPLAAKTARQVVDSLGDALFQEVFIQSTSPHRSDGLDAATVDVRVVDREGNPHPGPIFLSLSIGRDEKWQVPCQSLGDGAFRGRVTSELAGAAEMVVIDGSGRVLDPAGTSQTVFEPDALTHWHVTPVRALADADGQDRALFKLHGFDDRGNPVPRTPDEVILRSDSGVATATLDTEGNLLVSLASTQFGRGNVTVTDALTGVSESFQAAFPRLRLGDGEKLTLIIPSAENPDAEPQVDIPLIAYASPDDPVTGYDVTVLFDDEVCAVDEVAQGADLATTSFSHSVHGGELSISHRFAPASGRVELATITMSALREGGGFETIATPGSQLTTLSGAFPLTAEMVAAVEKEHKEIKKTIKLKIKIVKGTGGASLGTDAEAMDKLCKAVDKINKIYCQAKIKFMKEISTINCDLGDNGLDEYKGGLTAEEKALIDKCKPAKGEMVAFVVGKLSCGSLGESVSKGQFPGEVANGRTGTAVIDDDKVLDSTTFAHELGHLLLGNGAHPKKTDFPDCASYEKNLMHPTKPDPECITADQAKKMLENACAGTGF